MAIVNGTSGDDSLIGTGIDDLIFPGDGADTVNGAAGNDTVWAGAGDTGDDALDGDVGADILAGGGGNDRINGGPGAFSDTLFGGAGMDTISAGDGDDEVWGGADGDLIHGGGGNDILGGGAGDDTIFAERGDDIGYGGEGNDQLRGGIGSDQLYGGDGNDLLNGGADDDALHAGGGNDTIHGANGADLLSGGDGNDVLRGEEGDDTFIGGAGSDTIFGGDGENTLAYTFDGGSHGVVVNLNTGVATDTHGDTDQVSGISNVLGTASADEITGADGAHQELFWGYQGDDTLVGGAGNPWAFAVYGTDVELGGTAGVTVDLANDYAIDGFGDHDTLVNIHAIIGTNFDDDVIGSSTDDFFQTIGGDDTVDGGAGWNSMDYTADIFWGATGSDHVVVDLAAGTADGTFSGHDVLSNIQQVNGTQGDDTLSGDSHNNYLRGEAGDDVLNGRGGDDHLDGGDGDDTLYGGSGNDLIFGQAGDDLLDGGGDVDYVGYDMYGNVAGEGVMVDLQAGTATGSATGTDTLVSIENVAGTQTDDTLLGRDQWDWLSGQAGDDVIEGRSGDDTLNGGDGADRFVFAVGFGHDTVEDFDASELDVIVFGTGTLANYAGVLSHIIDGVAGLTITLDSGDSIFLAGVHGGDLASSEFEFT